MNSEAVEKLAENKWPQALWDLVDVVEHKLKPTHSNQARDLAFQAVTAIAEYHGGRMFYLPKGDNLKRAILHRKIWHDFTGHNIEELVDRYNLTDRMIYNIVQEQRKLAMNRKMGDLFDKAELDGAKPSVASETHTSKV